jgi:hypothetical protein
MAQNIALTKELVLMLGNAPASTKNKVLLFPSSS